MTGFGVGFGRLVRARRGNEGLSQEQLAVLAFGDESHRAQISRLEKGRIKNPHQKTVDALVVALNLSAADLEGCHSASSLSIDNVVRQDHDEAVRRRDFISQATGAAAFTQVGLLPCADESPAHAVMTITRGYRSLEAQTPSRQLLKPVQTHLEFSKDRIAAQTDDAKAWVALSETAGLAAWLHMDLYDLQSARDHYRLAVSFAERSGHQLLLPYMTGSLVQLAIELDDPYQALEFAGRTRAQLPARAPEIAHAWTATMEALAHSGSGNISQAMRCFDQADQAVARAQCGHALTWPWLFTFDHGKIDGYRALSLARFGAAGETGFSAGTKSPKQSALNALAFATGLLRRGQTDEACRLAHDALERANPFQSERVIRHAIKFRNALPDTQSFEAKAFKDTLAQIYG